MYPELLVIKAEKEKSNPHHTNLSLRLKTDECFFTSQNGILIQCTFPPLPTFLNAKFVAARKKHAPVLSLRKQIESFFAVRTVPNLVATFNLQLFVMVLNIYIFFFIAVLSYYLVRGNSNPWSKIQLYVVPLTTV